MNPVTLCCSFPGNCIIFKTSRLFPELITDRFILKQILPADQAFIFKGLSDLKVIPFYGVRYDNKTGCWWKIVSKTTDKPVGACGMNAYQPEHEKAEIGYWLLPDHWKLGIMPEVIPVMIAHLFSHWKLHRLEAVIEAGNEASCRLSEKLGFTYEGTLREAEIKDGKHISLMIYSLLAAERVQ